MRDIVPVANEVNTSNVISDTTIVSDVNESPSKVCNESPSKRAKIPCANLPELSENNNEMAKPPVVNPNLPSTSFQSVEAQTLK